MTQRQTSARLNAMGALLPLALLFLIVAGACGRSPNTPQGEPPDTHRHPDGPADVRHARTERLLRSYQSDPNHAADVLVLDIINNPRFFLTAASKRVVAAYELEGTELKPKNYSGTITKEWQQLEQTASAAVTIRELANKDPAEMAAPVRAYKLIEAHQTRLAAPQEHGQVVLETLLAHNPSLRLVYADDPSGAAYNCDVFARGRESIEDSVDALLETYLDLIKRHSIRMISRSMARDSQRHAESLLRMCDGIQFDLIAFYQEQEQRLIDLLSKRTGVLIVNANDNDQQPERYFLDGATRINPLTTQRAHQPLYVGYVDQPKINFSTDGVLAKDHLIPLNQRNPRMAASLFVDGNIDREIYEKAVAHYAESELPLGSFLEELKIRGLRWWTQHSFRFIYGQISWSPVDGNVGLIDTSGMATSWAAPLATGMLLRLAQDKGLVLSSPDASEKLKTMVHGRIFDPLAHQHFSR